MIALQSKSNYWRAGGPYLARCTVMHAGGTGTDRSVFLGHGGTSTLRDDTLRQGKDIASHDSAMGAWN
jgi:hypothetical protein